MNQIEIQNLSDKILEGQISTLKNLCLNFNPYNPIDDETKCVLESFKIEICEDPFLMTNRLLALMENSIEEWERRKH